MPNDSNPVRGTNFAITCNNYTEAQYDTLHVFICTKCKKGIIGKEQGKEGTPHLQGAFITKERFYFTALQAALGPGFHISAMRKPWKANKQYCLKDDKEAFVFDDASSAVTNDQGLRKDLSFAKQKIQCAKSWSEVMNDDDIAPVIAKYGKWAEQIWSHRPYPSMSPEYLLSWQHTLIDELALSPDPRKIIWLYDFLGNKGKSYLSRYLCCNKNAIEMPNKADATYYTYEGQRIVIWDLTKTAIDRVPYEAMEKVKNGMVISTKYVPIQKIFDQPHVVVFANYPPNENAWSKDRYDIREEFDMQQIICT